MEELNWLSSRIEMQTEKPNRWVYLITKTGREAFKSWLHKDVPLGFYPSRSETLMRFFSAQNDIADNIEALKKLENAYIEQILRIKMSNEIIARYRTKANSKMDLVFWKYSICSFLSICQCTIFTSRS